MTVPAAVRKAAEQADQIVKDIAEGKNPGAQPAQPAAPQPAQPHQAAAPARSDQGPNPTEDAAYWKQRFDVMNGKYNAEVPQLHQQLQETRNRLTEIERKQQQDPPKPRLTEDDQKEWGDTLDVMKRAARDEVSEEMARLQETVQRLTGEIERLGGTVTKVTGETYFERLDRELPEWRQINVLDAFLTWLAIPDDISGRPRMDHLQEHHAAQNADQVLKIFRAFLREQPNAISRPSAATPEKPGANAFVMPAGSSGSGGGPGADGKPRYTLAEITAAQKRVSTDLALGKYRGREEEANRLLREYDTAYLEGRVTA